jgi:hypothetical protein
MSGEVRHKNQAASLIDNSFGFRRKRSQRLRKGEGVGEAVRDQTVLIWNTGWVKVPVAFPAFAVAVTGAAAADPSELIWPRIAQQQQAIDQRDDRRKMQASGQH